MKEKQEVELIAASVKVGVAAVFLTAMVPNQRHQSMTGTGKTQLSAHKNLGHDYLPYISREQSA